MFSHLVKVALVLAMAGVPLLAGARFENIPAPQGEYVILSSPGEALVSPLPDESSANPRLMTGWLDTAPREVWELLVYSVESGQVPTRPDPTSPAAPDLAQLIGTGMVNPDVFGIRRLGLLKPGIPSLSFTSRKDSYHVQVVFRF
ncbi:MAG: hypothetical protein JSW54_09395 [Fidelibacterota bacterium]|nr:MAG: hypothetical protein JSW54_09395 [Candidatus Neomarinimicrobiota bacterium]